MFEDWDPLLERCISVRDGISMLMLRLLLGSHLDQIILDGETLQDSVMKLSNAIFVAVEN